MRGALGFSVLRTWPISGSVFWFSHLKTAIFGFGVLCGLWVFSNSVFGFRFLSTIMAVVQIFQSIACYGFSGFSKEVNSKPAYVAIYPDFLFEECMERPSLFNSRYLGHKVCQADYEKLKKASKRSTIFSNITRLKNLTQTSECGVSFEEKPPKIIFCAFFPSFT